MKNDHCTEYLADYLDGNLAEAKVGKIEEHLKTCQPCNRELEQLKILFQAFREEEPARPGPGLKAGFYGLLEQESPEIPDRSPQMTGVSSGRSFPLLPIFKAAAGIALLIGAYMLGKWQEGQASQRQITMLEARSEQMRQTAMLSLMENRSASKRIQGVHYIDKVDHPDIAVVKALIRRMLSDENTNVRLTAANALQKFRTEEIVKKAYLSSLDKEKEPAIQIAVIRILVDLQEKMAVPPMEQLLENQETAPFVKEQIKSLLPTLV